MTIRKRAILVLMIILLIYSLGHFYQSGIIRALGNMAQLKGDFIGMFPAYWAWKLNPEFIKQNPAVINWPAGREGKIWSYGPVGHFLTFPLIFLDSFQGALKIWFICCGLFLGVSIYLWYKMLILDRKLHSFAALTLFIFLWFNFFPLYEGISTGVIEIFELFLLTLSFYFISIKKEASAGVLLGFAAMTKFLPFIFIFYFFLKKRYRLVIASLITAGLMALLTEFTLGWEGNLLLSVLTLPGGEILSWYGHQSIPNLISRLFSRNVGYTIAPELIYPNAVKLTVKIVIYAMILFYGLIFAIKRRSGKSNYEIAILSILMISIIQRNETHYLIFLLIPFCVGLQYLIAGYQRNGKVNKCDMFILGFSFLLTGAPIPFTIFNKLFSYFSKDFLLFYLGFSVPTWGYLVLLGWFSVKYLTDRYPMENEFLRAA